MNEDIIAVSNERVPGEDPATRAGWSFRNAVTGDGIIADVITSGTLNASLVNVISASTDRSVRIADGNVYSYYQNEETMRFGSYRIELFDSLNKSQLGHFGVAFRTGDVESRGMSWVGHQSFISIGKNVDGTIRSFFDANLDDNILEVCGGFSGSQENAAEIRMFADEWVWGKGGLGHRYTDQPTIRLLRSNNGSSVYIYYGDSYSSNSTSVFEIRENRTETTYGTMLRCSGGQVRLYGRVMFGTGTTEVGWVEGTLNSVRLGAGSGNQNYIYVHENGDIVFIQKGASTNIFRSDGTKSSGSIDIDGKRWGMSPIDSPQFLIEYIIFDQDVTEEGVIVMLDDKYTKAVVNYAVFPSRGDVIIENKTPTSFTVRGPDGKVDLRIVGLRISKENEFWVDLEDVVNQSKMIGIASTDSANHEEVSKPPVLVDDDALAYRKKPITRSEPNE